MASSPVIAPSSPLSNLSTLLSTEKSSSPPQPPPPPSNLSTLLSTDKSSSPPQPPPPPSNLSTLLSTEKSSSPPQPPPPPGSSPPPSPPNSPPPVSPPHSPPPVSPPPASPPISPSKSPPPNSPPPLSPPPPTPSNPPSSSPPPPHETSPPPPTATTPPPSTPPPQFQSPPAPQLSSPPSSPPPPINSADTPTPSSPPPPLSPSNTPPSPTGTNSSSTPSTPTPPVIFSPPPPPYATPNAQPLPPAVVGEHSPPPPQSSSSNTAPDNKSPSPPGSIGSYPLPPHSTSGTREIIAGVVVGVGILALVVALLCILLLKRKKRQPYYMNAGPPPTGRDQYSPNWNNPMEHMVKISPAAPGVMVTPGVGAGPWRQSPSPSPGVLVPGGAAWGAAPPANHHQAASNTNNELNSAQHQQYPFGGPLSPSGGGGGLGGFSKFQFTYEELATATSGFAQENLLGQGGFGYVHKGVLSDGKLVAVKSLKEGSGQGEREFRAEVEIISRIHHRHLVSLVGYCIVDKQRMLVYEFVFNKTLEFHLHGKGQPVMDWATRLKIALGAAKGLAYIHEDCNPRIIHRDIKAANILLDDNNEAMVADFGLAKLTSDNSTHVSTRVMGTFGYLAPEYATSGKLTEKSDVFSFGVMLLELITGKRPVDPISKFNEDSLVDWARPRLTKAMEDGKYEELVDPGLEGKYVVQEMGPMISCAAACIRHSARRRPKMSQIVRALDGDPSVDLNDGPKPIPNSLDPTDLTPQTETYNTEMYNADMMKFNKMIMSGSDFTSSEFGPTSDYDIVDPSSSTTHH